MNKKIIQTAFLLSLGEALYISLVALLMFNINSLFGDQPDKPNIINPIAFLLLFVISASISGALVLGKPALLYLDGRKKEALQLFGFTLTWLVVFLLIAFGVIVARR